MRRFREIQLLSRRNRVVLTISALVVVAVSAHADPRRIAISTFLRAGPGHEFTATDEVINLRTVDVRGCAKDWCLVQYGEALGWVEQATLETDNALPVPSIPAGTQVACFEAVRSGWAGGDLLRICAAQATVSRSTP